MKGNKMTYSKPKIIAKNDPTGSFAAGCPSNNRCGGSFCMNCERSA